MSSSQKTNSQKTNSQKTSSVNQAASTRRVAVIGGGLAAFTAARTLQDSGTDVVMIHPKSPGATALWGGLGQAFGPSSELLPFSTGLLGSPSPAPRAVAVERQQRFAFLEQRRPFHPYMRLGLSRETIRQTLDDAVTTLGYPGLKVIDEELVLPSPLAAPYPADLAASSVVPSAIARGDRVGVVCCPSLADWHPRRLIDALRDLDGVDARALEVTPFCDFAGTSEHSVKVATRLAGALGAAPSVLINALEAAVTDHDLDLIILPPCLGPTWTEHDALFGALERELSCRVAEASASRNSIHGWRLDRYLRASSDIEVVSSRAFSATVSDHRLQRVETDLDGVEADAFIIATGRWIGGGLPSAPPLRESILGVDLWLDGAPIPNAGDAWPPNLLGRHVWDDHPLFRAGVGTDDALRPVDHQGEPVADNVFAAGRVLSGFNPFLDGTTEGVDLVTGHLAARGALEYLGVIGAHADNDRSHEPSQTGIAT